MPLTYTPTLHLGKPALVDPALIGDLNTNADLIDAASTRVVNVQGTPYLATGDGTTDDRAAILAAEAALGAAGGTLFFPAGTYRLASSTTLLATTHLLFHGGAQIAPAVGTTLTINGSITGPQAQIFGGAGAVVAPNQGLFWCRWFGAKGDNTGDDGPAINRAVAAAQGSRNATVALGAGKFRTTTQVLIATSNQGISFVGLPYRTTLQQSSVDAPSVLNWAGGATAAVRITATFTMLANLSIYNTGTGTAAFQFDPNGRTHVEHVAFPHIDFQASWSVACVDNPTVGLLYSHFSFCDFDCGPAIRLGGAATWIAFTECMFDGRSDSSSAAFVAFAADAVTEQLFVHHCTFNVATPGGSPPSSEPPYVVKRFVDNSNATTGYIGNLVIEECECDGPSNALCFIANLKNVRNFVFQKNEVSSFSGALQTQELIQLTAVGRADVRNNWLDRVNGRLVKCNDAVSRVFEGQNNCTVTNTQGILTAAGAVPGTAVTVTPGSAVAGQARLHGELCNPGAEALFDVVVVNNTAFSLEIPVYTHGSDPGWMEPGQFFTVKIKNTSGGVMGAVTYGTPFKTSAAFTVPANGFSRTIRFYYDGTNAIELSRSAADVAN